MFGFNLFPLQPYKISVPAFELLAKHGEAKPVVAKKIYQRLYYTTVFFLTDVASLMYTKLKGYSGRNKGWSSVKIDQKSRLIDL